MGLPRPLRPPARIYAKCSNAPNKRWPPRTIPPPKVDSAVVKLEPRTIEMPVKDPDAFLRFVAQCFHQKRKTIRNNLAAVKLPRGISRERVSDALVKEGVKLQSRAEELPPEVYVRAARVLAAAGERGLR